jgi:glycine/D-amino acid oxidase-like deaminating enzyme/nitrite reductase/ring-hydroxylating ferredoxin subunit
MNKSDEGATTSFWEATEQLRELQTLDSDIETNVCVIGAGIAGLSTAYLLCRDGRNVAVVDDGLIGGGETCRTTAHLSNAIDDRIYRIEKWHGEEHAKLAVAAHTSAIDQIEQIVQDENIDCDFIRLDGFLFEAEDGDDDLEEELKAAHRCGLAGVDFLDSASVGGFETGRCLCFPNQGQFHITKYLAGLVDAIERMGGRLFSHTHVTEWEGGDSPKVNTANGRTISAKQIVLATNYPLMSKMFAELPAYRTYAIGVEIDGHIEPVLLWDTGEPYKYIRTQTEDGKQILIVGGEDHRTGQADDGEMRFQRLFSWTKKNFPHAGELKYKWSGQCFETHDGLAFLGRYSSSEPNVFLITGDSGMGMTHCTIGAMLITDLIAGRDNPLEKVFDPSRKATQSIVEAVPEVISSTVPYKEWVTPGDIDSENDLKNGEGAILREGLSKYAIYKDEDGKVTKRSAVCTHMGCIVQFNSTEKTWDCPCHGSRFSVDGEVINSPAITPLSEE